MSITNPPAPSGEPKARGVQIDTGTYIGRQSGKTTFWVWVKNDGQVAEECWVLGPDYVEPTLTASAESEFVLTGAKHEAVDDFKVWLRDDQGVALSEAAVWQHSAKREYWR